MAPRKTLRSSTSNDPSCSLSPPRRTDTPENVQHTTAVAGADAAEDRPPTARPRGSVIPDSQENPSDLEFSGDDLEDDLEAEQPTAGTKDQPSNAGTEEDLGAQQALPEVDDSQDSFNTVDTVIIPGGTKLTPRRNTLHKAGINCNGRLATEHPDIDENMDEEATQPSTQPRTDPRRNGNVFMVSPEDEADVVCILHPTTPAAFRATELLAKYCPQHLLQNQGLSRNLDDEPVEEAPTTKDKDQGLDDDDDLHYSQARDLLEEDVPVSSSRDIALRFSSKVHNPCLGWSFGRNPVKCDLPIVGPHETLKISNMHFRIYLNQSGVLMLEDTSTNGTWVDKMHLQSKGMRNGQKPRRTIQTGSIIEILLSTPDPCMTFFVTVPSRDRAEAKFNQRLGEYLAHVKQLEHQALVAAEMPANGNFMAPPPVLPFGYVHRAASGVPSNVVATHSAYTHGMVWNGGEMYNVVGHIGKGAFANVYKLATKQDGELFAAKELEKRRFIKDGVLSHKAHNEIDVMKQLNHPNIINYIGHQETPKHLYIIMEYIPHGDLTQYVNDASVMPEYMCRYVAHQMINALSYLHERKITHRDVKPDNILIANKDPLVVKLTDFGLSKAIVDETTFLRTFCGTLLYCAPEVYPGYEKVKNGLPQKRRRELDEKKLPYKQSVDTWAFAAVLYHLMCGKPPFTGTVEDRGAMMLETIMHNDVDFDRLTRAGVSSEGVDFVRKMLVREPSERATDAQCLRHPWIADLSTFEDADVEMGAPAEDVPGIEEEDNELDASQLSLNDFPEQAEIDDSDDDEGLEADELVQLGRSKRTRTDSSRAMGFRPEDPASPGDSFNTIPMFLVPAANREAVRHITDRVPSLGVRPEDPASLGDSFNTIPMFLVPAANRQDVRDIADRAPSRLFGEVGTSALRSSGVFGQDAYAALDLPMEGSHDDSISASDASAMGYSTESRVTSDEIAQHSLQYPQVLPGPAPSLLGTEALVDQMNMASPESGPSAPSVDNKPATPRTPRSRELSPSASAVAGSKRSSQEVQVNPVHTPSKRAKSDRSMTPSQPLRQTDDAPTQHHASQASGDDPAPHHQHQAHVSLAKSGTHTTAAGQGTSDHKGQQSGDAGKDESKATTSSTGKGALQQDTVIPGSHAVTQRNDNSSSGSNSTSTSTVQDTPAPAPSFPLPAPVLGRLNTVPGSVIETTHFNLTTRLTYYGRVEERKRTNLKEGDYDPPFTSYVYPQNMDNRVPKNALDLLFWRPGIEDDDKKGIDWIAKDDFWALIMTRTRSYIYVNGVKLTCGIGHLNYGKLYTGDIITIFAPKEGKEGEPAPQGRAAEYLKFECEFFAGLSKARRPEGHNFTIEEEHVRYQELQAKRSREASMVASSSGGSTSPAP